MYEHSFELLLIMRRKVLFLFCAVFLIVGCIPMKRITQVVTLDLTKYTEVGFFITEANSISRDYDPVGLISVYIDSGHEVEVITEESKDPIYKIDVKEKKGQFINASLEEAVNMLYQEAIDKGANGIINLKYKYISTVAGWDVTGMAIKLKEN